MSFTIGVFDSGIGGLTAVKEIRKLLPQANLIYFGDTGRVPYGTRSVETIKKYAMQDARFLLSMGVDAILVACGTVSSIALELLCESFSVPIIGVVESAALTAAKATKNNRVGVIGTSATIRSGSFEKKLRSFSPELQIKAKACPLFVPIVENGLAGSEIASVTCKHYLEDFREFGVDTLILGCTHFPLLTDDISEYLKGVTLINTGEEAAKLLYNSINKEVFSNGQKRGEATYFVSDDIESFTNSASLFLSESVLGCVKKIDIEKF